MEGSDSRFLRFGRNDKIDSIKKVCEPEHREGYRAQVGVDGGYFLPKSQLAQWELAKVQSRPIAHSAEAKV